MSSPALATFENNEEEEEEEVVVSTTTIAPTASDDDEEEDDDDEEDNEEERVNETGPRDVDDDEEEVDEEEEEEDDSRVLDHHLCCKATRFVPNGYALLTCYEKAGAISYRTAQLNNQAQPLVVPVKAPEEEVLTGHSIALQEFEQGKLPLTIKRVFPNNTYTLFNVFDLSK